MRFLAAYAQDPELTDAVLNGGDVHGRIAAELFGPDYTPEQRQWCKNGVYAFSYCAAPNRMASTVHAPKGAAEEAIGRAFPGIARFAEEMDAKAKERLDRDGVAWAKTMGGRRVAAAKSKLYALRNFLMQGSGADAMKMAMDRCQDADIDERYLKLTIHDELLVSSPDNGEVAEQVRSLMEFEFMGVPFEAHSSEPGDSWGAVA